MLKVNIGKGIDLEVDTDKLGVPPMSALSPVAQHIVYIGLRNVLMDAHASIKSDTINYVTESRAVATRKLEAMYNGDVRVAGTREGDPIRAEAKRLAIKAVETVIKKRINPETGKPHKVADFERKVIVEKALANIDKFMDKARENVANAKSVAVDIDL